MVFKVYRFQKRAFLFTVHAVNWRNCRNGKTKTNKMVFSTIDFVLIKVLCQEKGYDNWWSHCFIADNCERIITKTCVLNTTALYLGKPLFRGHTVTK